MLDGSPATAYEEEAANDGVKVAPKVKKKAPKEEKTTDGKVLPRIHSSRPVMTCRRPPKK